MKQCDRHRRKAVGIGITTMLVTSVLAQPFAVASSARVTYLQSISNPYPFEDSCFEPDNSPLFSDAQDFTKVDDEPHVAVNPKDPDNIVAAWLLDGHRAVVTARSTDGGASWSIVTIDGLDVCSRPEAQVFADEWLAFGVSNGGEPIAYLNLVVVKSSNWDTEVLVLTSIDGGATWSAPIVVHAGASEKPSIATHPTLPCRAYSVWSEAPGLALFADTSDCGDTWSEPRTLVAGNPIAIPFGSLILVDPDGTLLHVFMVFDAAQGLLAPVVPEEVQMMVQRSHDDGETWSDAIQIGQAARLLPTDPDGEGVFAPALPTAAMGPDGTAYVAWQDNETPASIKLTESTDGGHTWTEPSPVITVNHGVFTPTLAVTPDGTVGITYYDFRNDEPRQESDPSDEPLTTDVWFMHRDPRHKATWRERHIVGPFDLRTAIRRNDDSPFLGDYQGLAASRDGFAATFAMSSGPGGSTVGASDIFFARLSHPGARAVYSLMSSQGLELPPPSRT